MYCIIYAMAKKLKRVQHYTYVVISIYSDMDIIIR